MIDVHCHLLPGLDHGAQSVDEAVGMVVAASREGIHAIIATPHFYLEPAHLAQAETFATRRAELRTELERRGLRMDLYGGAEVRLEPGIAEPLSRLPELRLAGSHYVLLEPPFDQLPLATEQVIFDLQVLGFRPVFSHPERCGPIQEQPERFLELVGRGVLGQMSARSIIGLEGPAARRCAMELLARGGIHFIASDSHAPEAAGPRLGQARDLARRVLGEKANALVEDNPARVLNDELIPLAPPAEPLPSGWRRLLDRLLGRNA
jgi:protein-tyrosine phosphatase